MSQNNFLNSLSDLTKIMKTAKAEVKASMKVFDKHIENLPDEEKKLFNEVKQQINKGVMTGNLEEIMDAQRKIRNYGNTSKG